jgi:hypothetical protein
MKHKCSATYHCANFWSDTATGNIFFHMMLKEPWFLRHFFNFLNCNG